MKKTLKSVILLTLAALAVASCGPKSDLPGFNITKSGLYYKFEQQDKNAQQVKVGDVIHGEVMIWFDTDTANKQGNWGDPQRIATVQESVFKGDLSEGLLMMHIGDIAVFAIDADSMERVFTGHMPPTYTPGAKQKFYYKIKVDDVISAEEIAQEAAVYQSHMEELRQKEPQLIADYVAEHNITATPNSEGLYVIVKKKGNGPKVEMGKKVSMHYVGRLLDGTLFDTSRENVASAENKLQPGRPYEPLTYVVGQQPLIPGWEKGVLGQPAGTQLTLIIPSALGYGSESMGPDIPAYSTLVFDIEILSVGK